MKRLLTVEAAFFAAIAAYLFATGSFWSAWPFVILTVIYGRAAKVVDGPLPSAGPEGATRPSGPHFEET